MTIDNKIINIIYIPNDDKHLDWNYNFKSLDFTSLEPTNQNSINSTQIFKPTKNITWF